MTLVDSYRYVKRNRSFTENDANIQFVQYYRFRSEKSRLAYIVRVESYPCDVFAIKFYLKSYKDSPLKYRMLTYTFEARRIINTCINILLEVLGEYPTASFGFIGANSEGEPVKRTKRFRVYSKMVATYFSDKVFLHVEDIEHSAYLLVNRKSLSDNGNLIDEIKTFFVDRYNDFD